MTSEKMKGVAILLPREEKKKKKKKEAQGVTTTLNMRNGCDFSKISAPSYNNFLFLYI